MTKEALKLALEALEALHDENMDYLTRNKLGGENNQCMVFAREAITTIKEALAQPEQDGKCKYCTDGCHACDARKLPEQEPVAWRTFDGEGGYEYRSYDMNEQYAQEWEQRNPKHKWWVEPLYTFPQPCPTCEALARTVMMDQTGRDA